MPLKIGKIWKFLESLNGKLRMVNTGISLGLKELTLGCSPGWPCLNFPQSKNLKPNLGNPVTNGPKALDNLNQPGTDLRYKLDQTQCADSGCVVLISC